MKAASAPRSVLLPLGQLAALHVLGLLDPEAMQTAVDRAMNEGFYDDTCLDALDSRPAQRHAVEPAFLALLRYAGLAGWDRHHALARLIEHHAQAVADGQVEPWTGLCALKRELDDAADHELGNPVSGDDPFGLRTLFELYHRIDHQIDPSGPQHAPSAPSEAQLHAIVAASRAWLSDRAPEVLAAHPAPSVMP